MIAVEQVHAEQEGDAIVIFHMAVEQAEFGARFQLLGDNGFLGIGRKHRRGEFE